MTIRDSSNHIRVLLYSYYTTITGWGVLLNYHIRTPAVPTSSEHKPSTLYFEFNNKTCWFSLSPHGISSHFKIKKRKAAYEPRQKPEKKTHTHTQIHKTSALDSPPPNQKQQPYHSRMHNCNDDKNDDDHDNASVLMMIMMMMTIIIIIIIIIPVLTEEAQVELSKDQGVPNTRTLS